MTSSLSPGAKIGRYEIRSQVGSGGMGEVYLAFDTELDRTVAIKILPADLASEEQRLQRFIQEAKSASALNHPHILTIYEIGNAETTRFIATEFIDGDTLRHKIDSGMSLLEVFDIAIQIASALAAAHAAGIIHRDIKPENIMVRRDGYIKLLDFGLAKLTQPEDWITDNEAPTKAMVHTVAGKIMGTTNYMSPEQAKGVHVDARTDLWSLGAVMYEMLSGHVPFRGDTPTETMSLILQKEPAPVTHAGADVPAEFDRIVSKTLTKNREERYQSAKDLLIDLRSLKRKVEADAELSRTASAVSTELRATVDSMMSDSGTVFPRSKLSVPVIAAETASSAEYILSEIKKHKLIAGVILVVLVGSVIGLTGYLHSRNTEVAIESVAVLPFENQNQDPNSDYLSDGVTESIINSLTQLPNLRVISRNSVFRYKGKQVDPVAVGKELGVRAVLTGRIMQRGDSLVMSTELVDVRDNKQLWGEQYSEKLSNLLVVQRRIASQITTNLRPRLSGVEQGRVTRSYTQNSEAYQLYLKGRFYWNKRTGEGLKKSIEFFNQTIEKDPAYSLAYAGLADAYLLLPYFSAGVPEESYPKATAAAKRALELDETLAEAHTSLANALFHEWKFPESNREFERAIELNSNYATAHQWYSNGNLLAMGRFEQSIAEAERARELDPLSLVINADLGQALIYARQPDKAIAQLRKTLEMDQNFYYSHWLLGVAYQTKGSLTEAIAEYRKARQLNDDPHVLALLGHALALSGKREEALNVLAELKQIATTRYVSAYSFAIVYAGLGDKDHALQWLEKAYESRAPDALYLKSDPLLENLRSDSRFQDLIRRVGLPE